MKKAPSGKCFSLVSEGAFAVFREKLHGFRLCPMCQKSSIFNGFQVIMEHFSFLDFGIRLFKFQRKREAKRKNHHHPFGRLFPAFWGVVGYFLGYRLIR